jgi:hypothetical protein
MKKTGRKFKPIIIPILFFLLVFTLLTKQNLQYEKELPFEGWSRSLPLKTGVVGEVKPVIHEENGSNQVFVPKENEVLSFKVDKNLQVTDKKTIPVAIPSPQNFWTKNGQFVFVKNNQLIHFDGKEEKVLDNDVDGMDSNKKSIIYYKEHEVLRVDPKTFSIQSIDKVKERLRSVVLNASSQSFISVGIYLDPYKMVKAVFYQNNGDTFKKNTLMDKEEQLTENHFGFYFVENGSELTVYYTQFKNASGTKLYNPYHGTNTLGSNSKWEFTPMTFQDMNGVTLENPKYIQYGLDKNNKAKILFTTRAMKTHDKEAVNVYEAKPNGDIWLTERRSTTNYNSMNPDWIGENSIMWMNLVDVHDFTFSGASTNKTVINKSLETTFEDMKQASSTTFLSLFQGLILAMSAIYWVVPSVLFAIVIYFVNIQLMEDEDKRVKFTILSLYLIVQFIFMQKLFNEHFYNFAPDFLTFTGSSFVLPVIIALLSWLAVRYGKIRDWGMLTSVCYFVAVNVIFLSLTVGPYMF